MAGVTVILWSTLPAVSKLIISQLDAFSTTFYVSLIAALTLFVINLVRGGLKSYTKYSLKDYARITGLGFLGLGCYTMLYYAGISYLTSQIAAIINYMWPYPQGKAHGAQNLGDVHLFCGHAPDMPAGIVFSFCKGQCRRHAVLFCGGGVLRTLFSAEQEI